MTEQSTGLPSPQQVIELLGAEFTRAGYEIDDVTVTCHTHPPRITVIVDADTPVDMNAVAQLSRLASALLDGHTAAAVLDTNRADPGGYVLEVSSPGIDRPLTDVKHFRRARGRMVDVELADGSTVRGRLGASTSGAVELVVRAGGGWDVRQLPLSDICHAVVKVEFSAPSAKELELAGGQHRAAGTEVGI